MNGLITCVDMNVLPLGSYDFLIGMDWLEAHRVKMDCYNKAFECLDEEEKSRIVKGIPKVISMREVSAMQFQKLCRKGLELYATHILEAIENETPSLEDFHVLQEFRDLFPNEILWLPPNRDIDFTIDFIP